MAYQLTANTWIDDNGQPHDGVIGSTGQQISNPVVKTAIAFSQATPVGSSLDPYANQIAPSALALPKSNQSNTATVSNTIVNPVSSVLNTSLTSNGVYSDNAIPIWTTTPLTPLVDGSNLVSPTSVVNTSTGSSLLNVVEQSPLLDVVVIGLLIWSFHALR